MEIRLASAEDRGPFEHICQDIGLFIAEEIEFMQGLFSSYIAGEMEEGHSIITAKNNKGVLVAAAYYGPEPFADNVYNVYFIGVLPEHQGHGYGRKLMSFIEAELAKLGVRILLVETSSKDSFDKTRAFYKTLNYELEARITEKMKIKLLSGSNFKLFKVRSRKF